MSSALPGSHREKQGTRATSPWPVAASPWLVVASLTGCADWLGLSELSFDEPPPDEPAPMTGAGGALVISTPPLESPPQTPQESQDFDDFAATWPDGALAAFQSQQPEPFYWVYDPQQPSLSTYRLRPGDDLVGARQWAPDLTWTHLVHAPTPAGPMLIGYDAASGIFERITNFSPDGGFDVERSAGNRHTHFFVGTWQDQSVLVGYQLETGFYRVVPAHPYAQTPPLQGNLRDEESLDCEQLLFARVEWTGVEESGDAGLLCYEASAGLATFLTFEEPEGGADTGRLKWRGEAQWPAGLVLASSGESGSKWVLRYDPDAGSLELSRWAVVEGVLLRRGEAQTSSDRLGLTQLWPFEWRDWMAVVTFDGSTADLRFPGLPGSGPIVR